MKLTFLIDIQVGGDHESNANAIDVEIESIYHTLYSIQYVYGDLNCGFPS